MRAHGPPLKHAQHDHDVGHHDQHGMQMPGAGLCCCVHTTATGPHHHVSVPPGELHAHKDPYRHANVKLASPA